MSLLALMADKFELEPPPASRSVDDDDDDDAVLSPLHDDVARSDERRVRGAAAGTDGGSTSIARDDKEGSGRVDGPIASPGDGTSSRQETKLLITFLLMVIVGTANKVFQKLQAIPMYNYPNSLNLLQNFVYVPLCFAYILPVRRFGLLNGAIPREAATMKKGSFAIMGLLDCITCLLLTFAAVYLPGTLLVLLPQAAIPISMVLSSKIKGERYAGHHYLGAAIVVLGILVVMEPLVTHRHAADFVCEAFDQDEFCALCQEETTEEACLGHRAKVSLRGIASGGFVVAPWNEEADPTILRSLAQDDSTATATIDHDGEFCRWIPFDSAQQSSSGSATTTLVWSIATILACVPMTLSSIYKEQALSGPGANVDPIFLNGWVALFQLLFSFPLGVPAGMAADPPVAPRDLPRNVRDGFECYLGTATVASGCHPDDECHESPLYVNVFLALNVCFNVLIVYVLKFGSANVLFIVQTAMVPLVNLAFALPFVPGSAPLRDSDVAGLALILLGLVAYQFGDAVRRTGRRGTAPPPPWRRGKTRHGGTPDGFGWGAPAFDGGSDPGASRPPSSPSGEPLLGPVR